jgi:DNA-binding response OmpR family regulator
MVLPRYQILSLTFYELAILDYLMPSINGLRLYDELRGKDDSIRGILLTGSQHMKEFEKIQDVILKPVHAVDLVQRVRSILKPYTRNC